MFDLLGQTSKFEVGVGTSMFDGSNVEHLSRSKHRSLKSELDFNVKHGISKSPLPPSPAPATHNLFLFFFRFFFFLFLFFFFHAELRSLTSKLKLQCPSSLSSPRQPPTIFSLFFRFFPRQTSKPDLKSGFKVQTWNLEHLWELHGRAHPLNFSRFFERETANVCVIVDNLQV